MHLKTRIDRSDFPRWWHVMSHLADGALTITIVAGLVTLWHANLWLSLLEGVSFLFMMGWLVAVVISDYRALKRGTIHYK
ncbi:hypothetical protein [Levilactobacillus spicheri]|uniref:Uncharacterized protein n=2 Tax=Levilactobacillus spicheri TaxID=216463 RepID=A0ABQ0WMW4_9LACO|nr:hypothetical protein [Levilactobacillus spicheri]GEO66397.1 hypothetical protein LSP04_08160 [Levilactobacillus spicheri]